MTDETREAKALRAMTAERDRFRAALERIAAQATTMPAWWHAQYVLHNDWRIPGVAFVNGAPMYVLTCGYCHQTWQALPTPGVQNDCPDPAGICSCTLECIVSEDEHAAWQIAAKVSP